MMSAPMMHAHFWILSTALGLTQHVTTSTHVKGNILNLIFTEETSNIKLTSCQAGPFLSDHKLVTASLNIQRQPIEKKKLSVGKLHSVTENSFKAAFDESAIDLTLPVETVLYQLNNELHKALDTIVPLKQIQVAPCQKQPWFDEIVKARHKVVQNREWIWYKYPAPDTWKAYKVERNVYNRLLIYKKRQLITKQVIDSKGDNKKLYKLMAHLSGARSDNPLPPYDSDESLANQFADYFITKIDRIRDNFSQTPVLIPETTDIPTFQRFAPLTTEQVTNLISSMQTKSCELDPIPTHILKRVLTTLIPIITHIVNASLTCACFCEEWKTSVVKPLLKKKGLDPQEKNYCPVSNLPFFSKLAERATLMQFDRHCRHNHLLPDFQSAYRKGYSTETSLIKMANNIFWSMERKQVTAMIVLDMSAAFDTVDHDLLLEILHKRFGIAETALQWYQSYLRP